MGSFQHLVGVACATAAIVLATACTSDAVDGSGGTAGSSSSAGTGGGGGGAASSTGGTSSGGSTGGTGGAAGGGAGASDGGGGTGNVAGMGGIAGTSDGGANSGGGGSGTGGTGTGGAAGGTGGVLDCGTLVDCGGSCVDPLTDPNHCGGCGKVCVGLAQCQAGTCACGVTVVSLSMHVQPILDASCNVCHSDNNPPQGLDLTPGHTYAFTVDVLASQCSDGTLRVAPGDPEHSYLLDKILGVDLCQGDSMPKNGAPLSAASVATISNWICQGAEDN
jgi:hypothetical protein